MKFRTLSKWNTSSALEGLMFFAQLLEELLFDYSLDTYKPSAMNTSSLSAELLYLIDDINKKLIDENNLTHVLKEFLFNLKNDEVALSLIDLAPEILEIKLIGENPPLIQKKTILEIINSSLRMTLYKKRTEEMLLNAVSNGNEKNKIRALTRSIGCRPWTPAKLPRVSSYRLQSGSARRFSAHVRKPR